MIDFLFPIRCIGCGLYDTIVCDACVVKNYDVALSFAHTDLGVDDVLSLGPYHSELWQTAVDQLKFRGVHRIGEPLGIWIARAVRAVVACDSRTIVIPIPLHWRRVRQRGYNQADVVAQSLSRELALPVSQPLVRHKATKPQSRRAHHKRWKNVAGAFSCTPTAPQPSRILLIDDVITTGSTTRAAVMALRTLFDCPITIVAVARSAQIGVSARIPVDLLGAELPTSRE